MCRRIHLIIALSICMIGCASKIGYIDQENKVEEDMAGIVKKAGSKVYIEGVPKISFGKGHCTFAGALVACMESMGEDVPYHYITGTSGAAFRFLIDPGEWSACPDIQSMAADQNRPIRQALKAIGYGYVIKEPTSREYDMKQITDSIDKGIPVIAFGTEAPGPEASVIAGYDNNGEIMLGQSYFRTEDSDPIGYFRSRKWYDSMKGYVLLGGKIDPPPSRQTYINSLKWAIEVVRTPKVNELPSGLVAYNFWADDMLKDEYFSTDDMKALSDRHHMLGCNLTIVDDRGSAAKFLRQIAEEEDDLKADLLAAAGLFSGTARLVGESNKIIGHAATDESLEQIADPEVRRRYSEMILKMRDNDEKAIGLIEHALEEIMEPEFTTREKITVLGLMEHFTPENEDFEGIWKRYMAYHDQISSSSIDGAHYGVYFYTEGKVGMDYLAGMALEGIDDAPEGLTLRDVPGTRCAVFKCTVRTISETYDKIFKDWLPASEYEEDHAFQTFERYAPNTEKGSDPVLIYVPIHEKAMTTKEHEIVELEAMSVLGVIGTVNSGADIGELWEPKFSNRMKAIQKIAVIKGKYYGVSFDEGGHQYLAGMVVDPPSEIPDGLVLRKIPAGKYAKFEGSFHEWWMKDAPDWVYDKWLPESQYEHNPTTSMKDFVIHGTENWVIFYVPVREKE